MSKGEVKIAQLKQYTSFSERSWKRGNRKYRFTKNWLLYKNVHLVKQLKNFKHFEFHLLN